MAHESGEGEGVVIQIFHRGSRKAEAELPLHPTGSKSCRVIHELMPTTPTGKML